MAKRYPTVTIDYTICRGVDESETEIDVKVKGIVIPYFPGSFDEPPSGGEVEDIQAFATCGKKQYEVSLTDDEISDFSQRLLESSADEYEPDDFDDRRLEIL